MDPTESHWDDRKPKADKIKQSNKAIGLVGTIARLFSDALPVTPFWASYIMILL